MKYAQKGSIETRPCDEHPPADTLEQIACTVCGAFKLPFGTLEYMQVPTRSTGVAVGLRHDVRKLIK